jgi:hypothetical protein
MKKLNATAEPSIAADSQPTFHDLERIIEEGEALRKASYRETGKALHEIKSHRLFKETHRTWRDYVRKRWGFSRQRAHQLMQGWAEAEAETSTAVDIAKTELPAEGTQHACGMNRTTAEFDDYDSGKPNTHRRFYTDSPVGAIHVTTSVEVLSLTLGKGWVAPFLRIKLMVEADETYDQPDVWSVIFVHFADIIMDGIEDYLKKYCPAPNEVLETLITFEYARK